MLVLSRREQESVEFPALGVSILVVGLTNSRVQLGFEAPSGLKIQRSEILAGKRPATQAIETVAEQLIDEDLDELESILMTLAHLAGTPDSPQARQLTQAASLRLGRIRSSVSEAFRNCNDARNEAMCAREKPTGYGVYL